MGQKNTGEFHKVYRLTLWKSRISGWRWHLKANNGRTVAASSEGYRHKRGATDNIWDATGVNVDMRSTGVHERAVWEVHRYSTGRAAVERRLDV